MCTITTHKSEIDNKYPDRHTLIIGNSLDTIPKFNNDKKYDLIFIDGGHEYNISYNDLKNCKRLAHSDTLVIMDDVVRNKNYLTSISGLTKRGVK